MQDSYDTPAADEPSAQDREEQTGTEQETALLPRSIFGQKEIEVGKECKFRIVHVYDDEVEVEYVAHDDNKPDSESGDAMNETMGEMDKMADGSP